MHLCALNLYHFVRCSTNNTRKKTMLTKKRHFECVFERHMQWLKRTFRNYTKRKMSQEKKLSQKNKRPACIRDGHDSKGVLRTENTPFIQHHLKETIWYLCATNSYTGQTIQFSLTATSYWRIWVFSFLF